MRYRAWIAEAVGTFALTFVGVGAIAANALDKGGAGLAGVALAHGLTIAAMASATAGISGGHINPAVTIGAFVARKIDPLNAAAYVVAQCAGSLLAALLLKAILPGALLAQVGFGTPVPGNGVGDSQALLLEAVLTFFLMFVIYGTALDGRAPRVGALFIGLTVTLDILIGGPFTGAAMNPARFLGPALAGAVGLQYTWIYWLGPAAGAIAAALLWSRLLEQSDQPEAAVSLTPPARRGRRAR